MSGTFPEPADVVSVLGMLWGKVLRSPSHARIVNIDATRARSLAGVRAVITGEDTPACGWGRMVRDVPLLGWKTPCVSWGRRGRRRCRRSRQYRIEEASRASTWNTELLPAIFDPGSDGARSPLSTRARPSLRRRQAPFSRTGIS